MVSALDRFHCTSSNTHSNVVEETHATTDDKEIKLLIIASIETLKHGNKKCDTDEVFVLVKDSLEKAITMESFEQSLELLQANHSIKCNIISNQTCLSIPTKFNS